MHAPFFLVHTSSKKMQSIAARSKGHVWAHASLGERCRVQSDCINTGCDVGIEWDAFEGLGDAQLAPLLPCIAVELPAETCNLPIYALDGRGQGWSVWMNKEEGNFFAEKGAHKVYIMGLSGIGRGTSVKAFEEFAAAFATD